MCCTDWRARCTCSEFCGASNSTNRNPGSTVLFSAFHSFEITQPSQHDVTNGMLDRVLLCKTLLTSSKLGARPHLFRLHNCNSVRRDACRTSSTGCITESLRCRQTMSAMLNCAAPQRMHLHSSSVFPLLFFQCKQAPPPPPAASRQPLLPAGRRQFTPPNHPTVTRKPLTLTLSPLLHLPAALPQSTAPTRTNATRRSLTPTPTRIPLHTPILTPHMYLPSALGNPPGRVVTAMVLAAAALVVEAVVATAGLRLSHPYNARGPGVPATLPPSPNTPSAPNPRPA